VLLAVLLLMASCVNNSDSNPAALVSQTFLSDSPSIRNEADFGAARWHWYIDAKLGWAAAGVLSQDGGSRLAVECATDGRRRELSVEIGGRLAPLAAAQPVSVGRASLAVVSAPNLLRYRALHHTTEPWRWKDAAVRAS